MVGKRKISRARSTEGEGNKGLAATLSKTEIKQPEPTGDDLVSGRLPQGVIDKLKPGAVVQKGDYVVKVVSLEKGHMNTDVVRYKKGFLNKKSGELEWGPESLGNLEQIKKWLLKGA
jgi:hypothetical protein